MNKQIIDIVNKLAEQGSLDFDLTTCYKFILNHCKKTLTAPHDHIYKLVNGCLMIDGSIIDRVQPLPACNISEKSLYYEEQILIKEGL